MSKKAEGFSLRFVLINTGNISRKVLSKVLRSFDKNFERLQLVCDYIVKQIDGEYAHLQNLDGSEEDKLVARALLPDGIAEGTKLHYELLQYEIIQ